jgi:putative two-component system response regulator
MKTRILIVDDDANLSRLSAMILEQNGSYEVLIEHNSTRALAVARQFKPALMLLDVDMPDKSGGELAREASEDARLRDVPILFLTGLLTTAEAGEFPVDRGGLKFLAKPVMPKALLAAVEDLTGFAAVR